MEGQVFDHHRAEVEVHDLDARWRNLNQTVPPHAQDWWDRNMAPQKQRIQDLKERVSESAGAWEEASADIEQELRELEELCDDAAERLGDRTAAGRAKSG